MTVRLPFLPHLLLFAGCLPSPSLADALSDTGTESPIFGSQPVELPEDPAGLEDSCLTCGQYATDDSLGADAYNDLCEDALDLQVALSTCVCGGACADVCGDNACAGESASDACSECMLSSDDGCGAQTGACLADV